MKHIYIVFDRLLLFFCCMAFFVGCSDYDVKGDASFYDNITVKVSGTENDTLKVNLLNKQQITLDVSDENLVFDMRSFIYHVDDTTVLKIDAGGNIEPLAPGVSEMSMVFRANPKVTASCIIKIWKDPVFVERIILPATIEAKLGVLLNLAERVSVIPSNADTPAVKYESLNPDIVSVSEEGIITSVAEGEGEIKVSSTDGSDVSAICKVIVKAEIKVADFSIPNGLNGRTIGMGQTLNLGDHIVVSPANADNKKLSYTITSGSGIITIDENGMVSTVSQGSAVILVSTTDGTNITKEITLNVDDNPLIDRLFWTVKTQTDSDYGHAVDGSTGAPEHLFDGAGNTFLSLVKPGKSFGSIPRQSPDVMPSFTIDMKSQQTFNYFTWRHRQGNNMNYLRVYGVKVEGSNDGENFAAIKGNEIIWIPNEGGYSGSVSKADNTTYSIDLPESSYRYVRVILVMWSDIYKGQHPNYAGNGASSGSTMQVSEFGLGNKR